MKKAAAFLIVILIIFLSCCSEAKTPEESGSREAAASFSESLPDTDAGTASDSPEPAGNETEAVLNVVSFEIESCGEIYEYSDDWFLRSAKIYSNGLALQSAALARASVNAPRGGDYSVADRNLKAFFEDAGFTGYRANEDFFEKPTEYSAGVGIARKTVGGKTLVAIAVRSANYELEWYSNMDIGASGDHRGFSIAADSLIEELSDYILDEGITGEVVFWICGHSRGAAVANLLSAHVVDKMLADAALANISYGEDDVFAYCLAAPAPTVAADYDAERYSCIHNVINPCDPVSRLPACFFGFHRYGRDVFLPSPMTEEGFTELEKAVLSAADLAYVPFDVYKYGLISKKIVVSTGYRNYNFEVFIDSLFDYVESQVPTREKYYAESKAICEFVGMINAGDFATDGLDIGSIKDIADAAAAFGSKNDGALISAIDGVVRRALSDGEQIRKTENFIVAMSHLFGGSVIENLTTLITVAQSSEQTVNAHIDKYYCEILRIIDDGSVGDKREYCFVEFDTVGEIGVYYDGVLAAKLDGSFKTVAGIESKLPYSVDDGGILRVFIPSYINAVEIRILSKKAAEGQSAVLYKRCSDGSAQAVEEKTFSLEAGKEFSFTVENTAASSRDK